MLIIDQAAIMRALTTLLNPEHGRTVEAFLEVRDVLGVTDEDLKAYAAGTPVPPSVASTLCAAMDASLTQFVCVADGYVIVDANMPDQLTVAREDLATVRGTLNTAMDQVERYSTLASERDAESRQLSGQLLMEQKQREGYEKQNKLLEDAIDSHEHKIRLQGELIKAQEARIAELADVPWYKRLLRLG